MSVKRSIDRSRAIFVCLIVALALVGGVSMETSANRAAASDARPESAQDRAKMEETLRVLESQQQELMAKIQRQRRQIRAMAEEHGSVNLKSWYELELKRLAIIQGEATKVELHRIHLEARLTVLEQHKETMPDEFQQTQIEMEIAREYSRRLDKKLNQEKDEIRAFSQSRLDTQDLQFRLDLDLELYDTISRRIRVMENQLQPQAPDVAR
jgi:hypothetical protein